MTSCETVILFKKSGSQTGAGFTVIVLVDGEIVDPKICRQSGVINSTISHKCNVIQLFED